MNTWGVRAVRWTQPLKTGCINLRWWCTCCTCTLNRSCTTCVSSALLCTKVRNFSGVRNFCAQRGAKTATDRLYSDKGADGWRPLRLLTRIMTSGSRGEIRFPILELHDHRTTSDDYAGANRCLQALFSPSLFYYVYRERWCKLIP